jgi:hypothetical protein
MKRNNTLGDLLVAGGILTEQQRAVALAQHRRWGQPVGRTVVALGYCSAADVLAALSAQTGIPSVELDAETPDPAMAELLSRQDAERLGVVPLRRCGPGHQMLLVAVAAPGSLGVLDALRQLTGLRVSALLADDDALVRARARLYDGDDLYAWPGGPLRPLNERMFGLDWAG